MRHILTHEITDTVRVHFDEVHDVVLEPHPKWSRTLGRELWAEAKAHMIVGMPINDNMMCRARADVMRYLTELIHTAELVEHRDGRWYHEPYVSRVPRRMPEFHKCGGPLNRCDCTLERIKLVLAW